MKKLTIDSPEAKSLDLVAENIAKLKALFPELLTEGKDGAAVNVDVLKQLVGDATVTDADEKYGLTWNGKRKARLEALKPSTGTLRPAKADSVDWDTTQNLLIEGDNLEVLKLLQKSYANQVKLIYIDPPYNTGKDFVYPDDYQDNLRNYQERMGTLGVEQNAETSGRFHTDWLNMLYPRLTAAKNLLRDDGIIFISIDDNEVSNAKALCDEVFGSENSVTIINWKTRGTGGQVKQNALIDQIEYVLAYCKSIETVGINKLPNAKAGETKWRDFRKSGGEWQRGHRPEQFFPFYFNESTEVLSMDEMDGAVAITPADSSGVEGFWENGKTTARERLNAGELRARNVHGRWKIEQFEVADVVMNAGNFIDVSSLRGGEEIKALFDQSVFNNPKPLDVLDYLLTLGGNSDSIVLDFFAGSGSTAHCVMAKNAADGGNRRYILVQLPEPLNPEKKEQKVAAEFCDKLGKPRTIAELTKERLRRAAAKVKAENPLFHGDLGFRVFKLDTSNLKAWDPHTANVREDLLSHAEHIKPDRTADDLLYELLLKKGLDLAVPMEKKTIAGKEVVAIGGGVMLVCLAEAIDTATAEPLALGIAAWHQALAPANPKESVVVFRDSAFAGNVAKSNLAEILKQRGLEKVNSI